MTFGEVLKELRIQNNLTQSELAKNIGLRQSHISAWENGSRLPLPDGLIKLADYFNCTVDFLLGREEGSFVKNDVEFISAYSRLNKCDKARVLGYIDALSQK